MLENLKAKSLNCIQILLLLFQFYIRLAASRRRPAPSGPQVAPAGLLFGPSGLMSPLRGSLSTLWTLCNPCGTSTQPFGLQITPNGFLSWSFRSHIPILFLFFRGTGQNKRLFSPRVNTDDSTSGPKVAPAGLLLMLPQSGSYSTLWTSGYPAGFLSQPFGYHIPFFGSLIILELQVLNKRLVSHRVNTDELIVYL